MMEAEGRRIGTARVGALGFGGAPLGNLYAPVAEDEALAAVRRAHDRGIRAFDTAPHYGNGLSEHRIGQVLRERPRDSFALSTKVGRILTADPAVGTTQHGYVGTLPFRQHFDYSHDGALRSIEDSLQRLGMARVDVAYIHDIDAFTHGAAEQPRRFREAMEGAYRALERLRREGTIKAIGLGVNEVQVCRDALAHGDFDGFLLAGRYTLLDQAALPELLPLCLKRGAHIVLGGPYNSGILATGAVPGARYDYKPASPEMLARVQAIEALCREHGVPLKAAALQFPLGHPAVACVIPGARSPAEVEENLDLLARPIPSTLWSALKAEHLLPADVPVPAAPVALA
ncbi:MAG: aldo/keto reductase [Alphaproteobacteria bacterium]|nr:aldo/keto reductase [Alphaproteobacteria bacterium]